MATVTLAAKPLLTLVIYKKTIKPSIPEILGVSIAAWSLYHVIRYSAFWTALTGSAAWNRTSKFKPESQSYLSAIAASKEELVIGLAILAFIVGALLCFPYAGLTLMLLIGLFYADVSYFAAPPMGSIAVRSQRRNQ